MGVKLSALATDLLRFEHSLRRLHLTLLVVRLVKVARKSGLIFLLFAPFG
jgi:hypothetical protein